MAQRILIAEDEPDLHVVLAPFLKSRGYETVSAMDGQEALDCFAAGQFDLVIVDLAMPKVNGWDVLRRLRKANPTLPLLALTAHDFARDQAEAFEAGCNEFVSKPFDPYTLLKKIQSLLSTPTGGQASDTSAV